MPPDPAFDGDLVPTRKYFTDCFDRVPYGRTDAWRTVGLWAVERLNAHLGAAWPATTFRRHGALPGGMAYAGAHSVAYFELVQLALWLELLSGVHGFASIRRTLRTDAREAVFPHLRLQLEVGALAVAAGHDVRFEPPIPGSERVGDVSVGLPEGQRILVEARVLMQDERTVAQNEQTDRALRALQRAASQLDVDCSGDLSRRLDDQELEEVLDQVRAHARLVQLGAYAPSLHLHGADLRITPRESTTDRALRGPALRGDLWPPIADRLVKKAEQTQGAENVWLRFTALQGLWLFTHWAQLELPAKFAMMHSNIRNALAGHSHVDGVVLSSALAWPQGTIDPDEYADPHGGHALRVVVPPLMARETLVLPLRAQAEPIAHARVWRDLYASEPDWPDHALGQFGLPLTREVFASPE